MWLQTRRDLIPTLPPSSSSTLGVNSLPSASSSKLPVHLSPGRNRLIVRAFTTPLAEPTSTVFDHPPSILLHSFQETEITTISQMQVAMSSNSFAIAKWATAKLKVKMLPAGFPVALCITAIQSCDRHSNRSFLILRIADFIVDAVHVVDALVSEFVPISAR